MHAMKQRRCSSFVTLTASTTYFKYILRRKIHRSRVFDILSILMFAVQCSVNEVTASSISSTMERISWKCSGLDQTSEFTVIYRLNIKDQCNAPDELLGEQQSIDCLTCNRAMLDSSVYSYFLDLSGLHPFSTYAYSVQPKTYGSAVSGGQFTTDTAG